MRFTWLALATGISLAVAGGGLGFYAHRNLTYDTHDLARAREAGLVDHNIRLPSGTELAYAEGPDNGPPLVLLHGQSAAWQSYARALPDLAESFHVYAVDIAGHGQSARTPGAYNVHAIASDLIDFVTQVVGEPVLLSGHSSGGLLAAQMAATAPELVTGTAFEDPPFFSTDADRMDHQFNFVDLARPAHKFLADPNASDFAMYYLQHNAWISYFGNGRKGIESTALNYRQRHPHEPIKIWFLPPSTNETLAYLDDFDPAFADAFYTKTWQADFDQTAVLAQIDQPSVLIHANWRITDAGILEGAMTEDDAARACDLISDCRLERVDSGHGFHFEKPQDFVAILRRLQERVSTGQPG